MSRPFPSHYGYIEKIQDRLEPITSTPSPQTERQLLIYACTLRIVNGKTGFTEKRFRYHPILVKPNLIWVRIYEKRIKNRNAHRTWTCEAGFTGQYMSSDHCHANSTQRWIIQQHSHAKPWTARWNIEQCRAQISLRKFNSQWTCLSGTDLNSERVLLFQSPLTRKNYWLVVVASYRTWLLFAFGVTCCSKEMSIFRKTKNI